MMRYENFPKNPNPKKKSSKSKDMIKSLFFIGLILVTLIACERPPEAPLQITDISVHPDPVIGQTATLRVEITSPENEQDVTIIVTLPDGVKLMSGELEWKGSLIADQPQAHEFALCVLYEGEWELHISTYSTFTPTDSYGDSETLHLITSADTVRVIPGRKYRIIQPPGGMIHPTPVPQTPPADICS